MTSIRCTSERSLRSWHADVLPADCIQIKKERTKTSYRIWQRQIKKFLCRIRGNSVKLVTPYPFSLLPTLMYIFLCVFQIGSHDSTKSYDCTDGNHYSVQSAVCHNVGALTMFAIKFKKYIIAAIPSPTPALPLRRNDEIPKQIPANSSWSR